MTDAKSIKSNLSKTTMNRTIHTMMTSMTVLTKALNDIQGDIKRQKKQG